MNKRNFAIIGLDIRTLEAELNENLCRLFLKCVYSSLTEWQEVVRLGATQFPRNRITKLTHHYDARYNSHFTFYSFGQMSISLTFVFQFILETTSSQPNLCFLSKFVSEEMIKS